jgi:hypothetical protein
VSEPTAGTITPMPPTVQLSLPGAEEMFAAAGLDTLPMGASELNPKQLRFAVEYLNSGNASAAAKLVGYSADNAEKLRKIPAVARFLNASAKIVAQNGDQLVRRKWELSVSYHAELKELRSKPLDQRTEKDLRREATVALMAVRNDTLLAALLNRLGIKLTGDVNVSHTANSGGDIMVIPPDALQGFAAARQEVAAVKRLQAIGGAN